MNINEFTEAFNAMNAKIIIEGRSYPVLRVTPAGVYIIAGHVQLIPQSTGRWLEITPENPNGSYVDAKLVN